MATRGGNLMALSLSLQALSWRSRSPLAPSFSMPSPIPFPADSMGIFIEGSPTTETSCLRPPSDLQPAWAATGHG